MSFKRTNRWDVQIVTPRGHAFGMKNFAPNEYETPPDAETVISQLEIFIGQAKLRLKVEKERIEREHGQAQKATGA